MSLDTRKPTHDAGANSGPGADSGPGTDGPVDGLDQAVHSTPRQVVRRIYRLFHDKRIGLVLILLTGLFALFGVLFRQAPAGVREDPTSHAAWLESVRPTYGGWTSVMDKLGLFNVFSSIPFLVLMVLLALSIAGCTIHRLPLLWRTAFHPHTKVTAQFFEHARLNRALSSPLTPDEAVEVVRADLRSRRFRIIEDGRGPGRNLYTDQWHLAPFGTAVAHLAFIVIMAGFLVSSLTGFRNDQFTLTVGRPTPVGHGTGLVAQAESFSDTYWENGTPKDYVTDLVLTRDGQQVARQEVRVNEPLTVDRVTFHQAYFGIAAVMKITDADGKSLFHDGVPLEWNTQEGAVRYGMLDVPGHDLELFVIGSGSGQGTSGVDPGQMRIEVYRSGDQTPAGTAVLDQGGRVDVEGLTFAFEREQQFTGLLVKHDPGAGIVWLGFFLLTIGTCATLFFRHHRIWVRATAEGDGSLIQLASPDRADAAFARRFAELGDRLAAHGSPEEHSGERPTATPEPSTTSS